LKNVRISKVIILIFDLETLLKYLLFFSGILNAFARYAKKIESRAEKSDPR